MPRDEVPLSGIERELAALDQRVLALQRDAAMAMAAIGAAMGLLAVLGGWSGV